MKFTLENIVNPQVKALFRSQLQGLQRVDTPDDLTARLVFYHQTEILAMSKRVKGYPDLSVRDALPWAHQIAVP